MKTMDKQRWATETRRPGYKTFKRRRRIGLLILALLAALVLYGLGAYLFAGAPGETGDEPPEQADAPAGESKETAKAAKEEEAERAIPPPDDPTLFLTVPRLGLYGHTVRNDRSEAALDLGAIKVPSTGFPWEREDTNTYIACHRIGFPGNQSHNQCLNLPAMQQGDEIFLEDTNGRSYGYRVSEIFAVGPQDTWAMGPVEGKDVVSLQTCTEAPEDWWTIGPKLMSSGPGSGRLVVQADRIA